MTKFSRLLFQRFASHFHSNGTGFLTDTALKLQNSLFLFSCFFMFSMLLTNSCTSNVKFSSSRQSRLVALSPQYFQKAYEFDAYVLCPLAKKFQNWIVDRYTARDFTVVLFSTNRWPLDVLTFLIYGFEKTHAKSLWCITWPDSATLLCTLDLSFMNLYPLLAKKCFKSCIKKLFSVLFKLKGQGQHDGLKSILNQYLSWFLCTGY